MIKQINGASNRPYNQQQKAAYGRNAQAAFANFKAPNSDENNGSQEAINDLKELINELKSGGLGAIGALLTNPSNMLKLQNLQKELKSMFGKQSDNDGYEVRYSQEDANAQPTQAKFYDNAFGYAEEEIKPFDANNNGSIDFNEFKELKREELAEALRAQQAKSQPLLMLAKELLGDLPFDIPGMPDLGRNKDNADPLEDSIFTEDDLNADMDFDFDSAEIDDIFGNSDLTNSGTEQTDERSDETESTGGFDFGGFSMDDLQEKLMNGELMNEMQNVQLNLQLKKSKPEFDLLDRDNNGELDAPEIAAKLLLTDDAGSQLRSAADKAFNTEKGKTSNSAGSSIGNAAKLNALRAIKGLSDKQTQLDGSFTSDSEKLMTGARLHLKDTVAAKLDETLTTHDLRAKYTAFKA